MPDSAIPITIPMFLAVAIMAPATPRSRGFTQLMIIILLGDVNMAVPMPVNDMQNARSYIDSKKGVCRMEFFIYPGNVLNKKIEFYAEVPTELGNYRISKESYTLNAMNLQ